MNSLHTMTICAIYLGYNSQCKVFLHDQEIIIISILIVIEIIICYWLIV